MAEKLFDWTGADNSEIPKQSCIQAAAQDSDWTDEAVEIEGKGLRTAQDHGPERNGRTVWLKCPLITFLHLYFCLHLFICFFINQLTSTLKRKLSSITMPYTLDNSPSRSPPQTPTPSPYPTPNSAASQCTPFLKSVLASTVSSSLSGPAVPALCTALLPTLNKSKYGLAHFLFLTSCRMSTVS